MTPIPSALYDSIDGDSASHRGWLVVSPCSDDLAVWTAALAGSPTALARRLGVASVLGRQILPLGRSVVWRGRLTRSWSRQGPSPRMIQHDGGAIPPKAQIAHVIVGPVSIIAYQF